MGMNNRLQNGQRLRNSFACVVDGETEIWYLNMLKRNEPSMKSISIRPELPQKKTLKEQFKQVQTLAESYTAVFWIFDLLKDYSKTRKYFTQEGNDIYKRLKPYLEEAIANSKATGEFDYENLEKGFCSMHKLFSGLGLDAESGQIGNK